MSETYKDHGHPPGWENEHDPRCQACAQSELASSDGSARLALTYAVEQRLRLVDFLLAQYGNVKRAALMDYFGIGEATATRDFGAYHGIAPGNMALNPSDKTYYRTNAFARVWK
jgi:hypothetical protein